jgi:hypothetical protein
MTAAILTICGLAATPGQVVPSAIAPPDATAPTPAAIVAPPDQPSAPVNDPNRPILLTSRTAVIDIDYDPATRKSIQRTLLYVSRDQGQTWGLEATAMPDQESFTLAVKDDGVYWCTIQTVYTTGLKTPADVTKAPADRKLFLDGTAPTVRIAGAKRQGDEIAVEWTIDEAFPDDAGTIVRYRDASVAESPWLAAAITGKRNTTFKPAVNGSVIVEVIAKDLVGNQSLAKAELPVVAAVGGTMPSLRGPPVKPLPAGSELSMPSAVGSATAPAPTSTPPGTLPMPSPVTTPAAEPVPLAVTTNDVPANAAPVKPINVTRFELAYSITAGPAGVNGIDLWVTRDDGRSWRKWSRHDGRETPLKVILDTKDNPAVEGGYGFKLVPESGSRLADAAPQPGTPPEFNVVVDVTRPRIDVYEPVAHADRPDVVVIRWKATDANFGRDPISVEYAEQLAGPWKSVSATDIVAVVGGQAPVKAQLPNTGEYGWRLPGDLSAPKVYLKFTATDLAGNVTEAMTREPILVDLTRPRAKIQGIVGGK